METPKTVRDIIAKGESAHVEFKSAKAGLEVLGKTICAFLNSGGGQIIVGVRDDGGLRRACREWKRGYNRCACRRGPALCLQKFHFYPNWQ
jgi:predicted HTH transcriptional regulator